MDTLLSLTLLCHRRPFPLKVHFLLLIYAMHSLIFQVMQLKNNLLPSFERKKFIWTVMPQGFTESPLYFSQILKANQDNIKLPRGSILLLYMDDLLLCSTSQASSQEDSAHLLKLFALERYSHQIKFSVCVNAGLLFRASAIRVRDTSRSR